jgi:hypothetical protein
VFWRTHLLEASRIGEHSTPSPILILVIFNWQHSADSLALE